MHNRMYERAEEIVKVIEGETDRKNWIKQVENLQMLGVVPSSLMCREEKNNSVSLAGLIYKDGKELAAGLRKYWINDKAKQEYCGKEALLIKEKVLIGTEFTFHHKDFHFDLNDLEKNNPRKGIDVGNRIIADWTGKLIGTYGYKKSLSHLKVTATNTGRGRKKFENAAYSAVEIEFCIEDTVQEKVVNWKVNFDLDPVCIELQTQPMPYQFFQDYGFCIDELLFHHIGEYGLTADKDPATGGGGHISLDARTAFSENAAYLRNFLVLYSCEAKREALKSALTEVQKKQLTKSFLTERQRQLLIASKDSVNAPFLFEVIDEWRPFQNFVSAFDGSTEEPMHITRFVQGMHSSVYINVTDDLARLLGGAGKVMTEDKQHYQAVNLEHVGDQGRIEMRRFDAQENVSELLDQLDALFEILLMARTNWKISIDKALESDYFAG
ncbi:MAG: hypothetical protein K2I22_09430 [Lachnospiraceae bacterium]|nr:hypothetical protein [Lachnospiraceae bacterium]